MLWLKQKGKWVYCLNMYRFNWINYYNLSKKLKEDKNYNDNNLREATLRTILSRTYYAFLIYLRNHLQETENIEFSGDKSLHKQLIEFLKENKDKKKRKIGNRMERLMSNRNYADYTNQIEGTFYKVRESLRTAEELVNLLNL